MHNLLVVSTKISISLLTAFTECFIILVSFGKNFNEQEFDDKNKKEYEKCREFILSFEAYAGLF